MTIEQAKAFLKAKLECMERDIPGNDPMCNSHNCGECYLNYDKGNMGEQRETLRIAINAIDRLNAFENAYEEIRGIPQSWEYGAGVNDCCEIIRKHLAEVENNG